MKELIQESNETVLCQALIQGGHTDWTTALTVTPEQLEGKYEVSIQTEFDTGNYKIYAKETQGSGEDT